jgi:UMF1 family MFS transporter
MSGAADKGHYRKQLLVMFGVVGSIATMCYVLITTKRYYISSLLAIIANSCFGAVNVCGNSFLPILVANYPTARTELTRSNLITRISGIGAASGYISALICQIISMVIILKTGSTTKSIQFAIFFIGLWWFVFQLPIIALLKSRQSSALTLKEDEGFVVWQYVKYGWKTLFVSLKHASMLKDVIIYLVGWFIVSDSVTTINSAAVLFAKTELQMSTANLVVVGILTVLFAIFGSLAIPTLQKKFKIQPKVSLILIILWASMIPFYGILGFFFKVVGLKHQSEMYLLAVWYGISMGGLTTLSRSLFSLLIPRGKESVFFSLFSITDKGSSIVGPIITGLIVDKTHNIRYTFYFLFALLVLAIPVYLLLDVERGEREAKELEVD